MNNRLTNLLGVADWVANSFPTVRIVLMVLAVLCCACVIVLALVAPAGKENGNVITGSQTNETFYSQNNYYTTAASRMSRGYYDYAVTDEDVIELCRSNRANSIQ